MDSNKTILFDWNGTLLDDTDLAVTVMNDILRKENMDQVTVDFYRNVFDFPVVEYYKVLGFDTQEGWELASKAFIEGYVAQMFTPQLYVGVREGVKRLKDAGFTLGIVSAMEHTMLLKHTEFYGLHDMISLVQGIENTEGRGKLHLAKKVKEEWALIPEQTCYVGDTTHDKDFSDALGSHLILKSGGHNSIERLEKSERKIVHSFDELVEYLTR